MRRIGAPVAKAAVYVFAFAFWALAMLLTYNLVGMIARGHIEEHWFALIILMFGLGVLFAEFSRYLIRRGVPKAAALFPSPAPDGTDERTLNPQMTKDVTAMAKNENPSFHFSGGVTFNASTNHNAPGGIIGNAPIVIHQHFDKPQSPSQAPDAQTHDAAVAAPEVETATLDELLAYAESLLGKAVAENTVRNILERAEIESCGEEKRGRARAKLFPKTQAEKAIADHVSVSKRK